MSPTVHPRSRGEHCPSSTVCAEIAGSSPLARGTRGPRGDAHADARFIPARAGNTAPRPRRSAGRTVHPRSRGEHSRGAAALRNRYGSSPLARGTPAVPRARERRLRFIPARAGNTSAIAMLATTPPVHPRSRGEHQNPLLGTLQPAGSSPLARGTHRQPDGLGRAPRFIPARAGNTGRRRTRPRPSPVHPRSRGEHEIGRTPIAFGNGSSPLARGTRPCGRCPPHCRRFIPARAGNT